MFNLKVSVANDLTPQRAKPDLENYYERTDS